MKINFKQITMRLLHCVVLFVGFISPLYSHAQRDTSWDTPQKMPQIIARDVINFPSSVIDLSRLNGKALLLDFSTTNCRPCIELLPKLDSLQRKYSKDLQIVFVTYENDRAVENMLAKLKKKNVFISFPIIYNDTTLNKVFKHFSIPHEVWVNKSGEIYAITDHEYITSENIDKLINNSTVTWAKKGELKLNSNQPLISRTNSLPISGSTYYSTITGGLEGYRKGVYTSRDSQSHYIRRTYVNYSILRLYMLAWNKIYFYDLAPNRLLLEVSDASKILYDEKFKFRREWDEKNSYCYEAVMPLNSTQEDFQNKFKNDLNYFFGLNGRVEKRSAECWVISKATDQYRDFRFNKNGTSLSNLIYQINRDGNTTVVIDETMIPKIDTETILLPVDPLPRDIDKIKKMLNAVGLDISVKRRELEFFVISDAKSDRYTLNIKRN